MKKHRHTRCRPSVYALKLEGGKYYIGISNNVKKRFKEHCSGKGSRWTQIYKPLRGYVPKILKRNAKKSDEAFFTDQYIEKYGKENVRGAGLTVTGFPKDSCICVRCGRFTHREQDCFATHSLTGDDLRK